MAAAWRERLGLMAAALWWGSLTAVGAWVVPLLFMHLPSAAMAGSTAARLFSAQTWVALACGLVLLMALRPPDTDRLPPQAQRRLAWVVAGMGLALLLEFVVAPRIVARQDLRLWHTVGTAMYALQWVCAALTLWRQAPRASLNPENAS